MMWNRNSHILQINVNTIFSSSVLEIGDSSEIIARSRAISVLRGYEFFYGNEGNFEDFRIFTQPVPIPSPLFSHPVISKIHEQSNIRVNHINVKGISSSGVVHIGSTKNGYLDSKVLHIRQIPYKKSRTTNVKKKG